MGELERSSAGQPEPSSSSRDLVLVVEHAEAKPGAGHPSAPANRFFPSRFHFAAAAALAVVLAAAGALFLEDRQQAKARAERTAETESLAHTIKSLKVRLDAIDTAMSNAGLADLRQSVGEIKSTAVSTREMSGALAHSPNASTSWTMKQARGRQAPRRSRSKRAVTAGLSTRIDKLEQKIAARPQRRGPQQNRLRPNSDNVSWTKRSSISGQGLLADTSCSTPVTMLLLLGAAMAARSPARRFSPGTGRVERIELRQRMGCPTSSGLIASAEFPRY
jgi:hypothetical protein